MLTLQIRMNLQNFTVLKSSDGELRVRDLALGGQRVYTQVSEEAAHRGQEGNTNGLSFLVLSGYHNSMTKIIRSR